jgi:ABC-2 type transport system permease protein
VTRILVVARREYLERVRSKVFLVGTLLGPALMAGFMILPGAMMDRQRGKPLRVAVFDQDGRIGTAVEESLRSRRALGEPRFVLEPAGVGSPGDVEARLKERVLRGDLDGFVLLPGDALASSRAEYYGKNVSNVMDIQLVDKAVEEALIGLRLAQAGLAADRVKDLTRKPSLTTIRLTEKGAREDRGGTFLLSLVLMMMLYTSVIMWGTALMNGVIEEKTNRVVEVIVSSVSPWRLFAGKLAGVGGAGLTQFAIWAVSLALLGLFGGAIGAAWGLRIPDLGALAMASFVMLFLLGYFLYGSLYMAIGASVNTQQEAQGLVIVALAPLVLGVAFFPVVLGSPDSRLAVVLSLVPFFAPLLMFLRIVSVTPPAWQLALCGLLMLVAIVTLNWAAARIYRVGILMYGKRPTLPEILRWVRHA